VGGLGSGRKSVKGQAINFILEIQILLNELLNQDIDSNLTREQLKEKVNETWQRSKKIQEELERL
jgi:hypothetical protein